MLEHPDLKCSENPCKKTVAPQRMAATIARVDSGQRGNDECSCPYEWEPVWREYITAVAVAEFPPWNTSVRRASVNPAHVALAQGELQDTLKTVFPKE